MLQQTAVGAVHEGLGHLDSPVVDLRHPHRRAHAGPVLAGEVGPCPGSEPPNPMGVGSPGAVGAGPARVDEAGARQRLVVHTGDRFAAQTRDLGVCAPVGGLDQVVARRGHLAQGRRDGVGGGRPCLGLGRGARRHLGDHVETLSGAVGVDTTHEHGAPSDDAPLETCRPLGRAVERDAVVHDDKTTRVVVEAGLGQHRALADRARDRRAEAGIVGRRGPRRRERGELHAAEALRVEGQPRGAAVHPEGLVLKGHSVVTRCPRHTRPHRLEAACLRVSGQVEAVVEGVTHAREKRLDGSTRRAYGRRGPSAPGPGSVVLEEEPNAVGRMVDEAGPRRQTPRDLG